MYRYNVERVDWLTPHIISLTLRHVDNERKIFAFYPGQYAAIAFRRYGRISHTRCFSITSSPQDPSVVQFGIRVKGKFTTALSKVVPGDTLYVRGPYGGFVLNPVSHKEIVLVAGGIGITPFMSMLRYLSSTGYAQRIHLLYGVQTQDDIAYLDELRAISSVMPNLRMTIAVSQGSVEKLYGLRVVQNRVSAALLHTAVENHPSDRTVYICGPPQFMNSLAAAARNLGVFESDIMTEAFKQGPNRQTGEVVSWPKNMYVLGGLGISVGALAITVTDIVKNLPTTGLSDTAHARQQLRSTSARGADLDTLVNSFPAADGTSRVDSPATIQAIKESTVATGSNTTNTSSSGTSNSTSSPASSGGASASSAPVTTPAPKPVPVCTTTQSGVKTCV